MHGVSIRPRPNTFEHYDLPDGFSIRILLGSPRRHRADVVQEALLAALAGRNCNTAARNYVAKEMRHERRMQNVGDRSQEPGDGRQEAGDRRTATRQR